MMIYIYIHIHIFGYAKIYTCICIYINFSFVISNQIIIFGGDRMGLDGEEWEDDVVEVIEGNELYQGPDVPFELLCKICDSTARSFTT